jgi:hypothetical protein
MALTEQVFVEKIEVMIEGVIRVFTVTAVMKDGNEVARSTAVDTLIPGSSLDGQAARVIAVAGVVWTQEVLDAWAASHPN